MHAFKWNGDEGVGLPHKATTRVCVERKLSFDWGDMCSLAFIAATMLNFWLALLAWPSHPKIQNCGGNEC